MYYFIILADRAVVASQHVRSPGQTDESALLEQALVHYAGAVLHEVHVGTCG